MCHNGSPEHDYAGAGIENPHPFPGADNLLCTTCHGGDGTAEDKELAHVPPPPEIPADPVAALRARNEAQGLVLHAHTATPGWLGEPLDLGYAIDVLHPLAR